jgi:hypothetical protein
MADIDTHLRELSVLVYLEKSINLNLKPDKITPDKFIKKIADVKNATSLTIGQIARFADKFDDKEKLILENGLKLAELIRNKLHVADSSPKSWMGSLRNSGGKIKHDVVVKDLRISLKEDSEIFDNMGLYRFCNILEGSPLYGRGKLHIFKEFAKAEFEKWFEKTRDLVVKELVKGEKSFENPGKYKSKIRLDGDLLILEVKYTGRLTKTEKIPLFSKAKYFKNFEPLSGKIKEHVFAKLINNYIEDNPFYIKMKNACSIAAGTAFVNKYKCKEKKVIAGLSELICLESQKYYYGKVTGSSVNLYEVPSNSDEKFNKIQIASFEVSVPESQCNVLTKLTNNNYGSELVLQSQMRYSHGQFKGIPEAKLYYESGDLSGFWKKL